MNEIELRALIENPMDGVITIPPGIHETVRDETSVYSRRSGLFFKGLHDITIVMDGHPTFRMGCLDDLEGHYNILRFEDCQNVRVLGAFTLIGNLDRIGQHTNEQMHGMELVACDGITIENVTGKNLRGDTLKVVDTNNLISERSYHRDNGRSGIALHSGHHITLRNISGQNVSDQLLDQEAPSPDSLTDVDVDGLYYRGDGTGTRFTPTGRRLRYRNVHIDGGQTFVHGVHDATFEDCHFEGAGRALSIRAASGTLFEDCTMRSASYKDESAPVWISSENAMGITVRRCDIQAVGAQMGIMNFRGDYVTLEENDVRGGGPNGIVLSYRDTPYQFARLEHNTFDGFGRDYAISFRTGAVLEHLYIDQDADCSTNVNDLERDYKDTPEIHHITDGHTSENV